MGFDVEGFLEQADIEQADAQQRRWIRRVGSAFAEMAENMFSSADSEFDFDLSEDDSGVVITQMGLGSEVLRKIYVEPEEELQKKIGEAEKSEEPVGYSRKPVGMADSEIIWFEEVALPDPYRVSMRGLVLEKNVRVDQRSRSRRLSPMEEFSQREEISHRLEEGI